MKTPERLAKLIGLVFLIALHPSCEEIPTKLGKAERKAVDTIVNNRIKILRAELDSMCDLNHQKLVDRAVDSIMNKRMQEIDLLLGKSQ